MKTNEKYKRIVMSSIGGRGVLFSSLNQENKRKTKIII